MKVTTLGLLAAILLTRCSSAPNAELPGKSTNSLRPQDLLIRAEVEPRKTSTLDKSQVYYDVKLLLYALKRAYAGRDFIDPKIFSAALNALSRMPDKAVYPLAPQGFLESVDKILMTLPDNHLQAQSSSGQSKARREAERRGRVGRNVALTKSKPWSLVDIPTRNGKLGVLSITHLDPAEDPSWSGFKDSVDRWLDEPVAILDLRGNGGGSDQMGYWLAARVGGKPIPSPYEYRMTSRTPETWAISANESNFYMLMNQRHGQPVPDYLKEQFADRLNGFNRAVSTAADGFDKKEFGILAESGGHKPYKGKVYLLMDADCASSCEGTIKAFERIPNATTVGENTGGYFQFGNVGILLLPNSGLVIQIPTAYFRLRDGTVVEKVGISPKIRLNPGQDALQYVIKERVQ